MARIKYYYNTESCKYEKVRVTANDVLLNILGFLLISMVLAAGLVFLYYKFFPAPEVVLLKNENSELLARYENLNNRMEKINSALAILQERDIDTYRPITGSPVLPEAIRKQGVGGHKKFQNLVMSSSKNHDLIVGSASQLDEIRRKLVLQSLSYDEIISVAKKKEKMLASMPAIQPTKKGTTRFVSGFGYRLHPIIGRRKMHAGVDFAGPKGTPIYATADGVIKFTKNRWTGYGKQVEINHGFGYVTKYAHMQKYIVKKGQKVKRGELIGYLGNSGSSTGPHLHYEVIYNGKKVNPVHYFYHDVTEDEYEKLLELAEDESHQPLS